MIRHLIIFFAAFGLAYGTTGLMIIPWERKRLNMLIILWVCVIANLWTLLAIFKGVAWRPT